MARIPITGIGVIAPGAIGIDAFRAQLERGTTAVSEVTRFDTVGLSAHKAALVNDFKPKEFIAPMKMRRMNALSRLGVAAAKLAIDDCGGTLDVNTGVAIGTAFGPVQTSVEYMQEYVAKGAALAPPQLFAESVANAAGSHIAIEWGLRGFIITITQRESSAAAAAMYAAAQLLKESVTSALIGGVDEANEMLFSVLDRIGALAHAKGDLDEAARPFDTRRNGLVLGEAGAVLVAAGGARKPYGWLSGFGIARDTSASISDWGNDPSMVVTAMRAAIADAELEPEAIDAIYASANGSLRGDALEQRAIQQLFGERMPPVVATKGLFGEYAAGGALQIAAALLALEDQKLHASPGFEEGELPVTRETR
ncbi:MAG TPA: beta-ketoacyl synthase N-terminal-like domain-containing protein, partial [Thermoanaerobaculia bacterium]|nr:beta-ketoacyl synthase N-terminal-like domain-containing protein [Thermoanaerobaculia bacterium]